LAFSFPFTNFSDLNVLVTIQSRLAGSILASIGSHYSMSRERTIDKGINLWAFIYFTFHATL
jgi:hypothetical protein